MCSCQSILIDDDSSYKEIGIFAKEIKKTDNLSVIGFGGGKHLGSSYNLTLLSSQMHTLDEARALFYNVSTRFLNLVNSNEDLRICTVSGKFSIENLSLSIHFPDQGEISIVGNGTVYDRSPLQSVYYFTHDSENDKWNITYEESYEEIRKIVIAQGRIDPSLDCQ